MLKTLDQINEWLRVIDLLKSRNDIKNHKLFYPSLSSLEEFLTLQLEEVERAVAKG